MNIILLRADDWLDAELAMVSDHRATHIRTVLKAQVGDALHVGLLGGECGTGVIESLDLSSVRLRVQLSDPPPPRHRFDLVMALPRPKMLRRILRQCAEFGVEHLHLINSARVEKSFWQSPLLRPGKVEEALQAGLGQDLDLRQVQRGLARKRSTAHQARANGGALTQSFWQLSMLVEQSAFS